MIFSVQYELKYSITSKKKDENNIENFYTHHRMKIYDKSLQLTENETIKYKFDIDESVLEKYEQNPEVYRYLKRMKDNKSIYYIIVQPNRSLRFRDDLMGRFFKEKVKEYSKNYVRSTAEKLANADTIVEFLSESGLKKYGKIVPQYNYYITIFSKGLSGLLQQLFVSTLAYEQGGVQWPDNIDREGFIIEFNSVEKTAILKNITIYNPDNPYNKYIRKSMRIVRKQDVIEDENKDAIDFYLEDKITPWCEYDKEEFKSKLKSDDNTTGVYMLYDSKKGFFYVGKSENVFTRMQQHKDSQELIKDFDFYRYSLIDPYYYDDIHMIENAAIHDCAMILNMFANKDYCEKSLAVKLPDGRNIKDIYIVNSVKKQTKLPNRKKK